MIHLSHRRSVAGYLLAALAALPVSGASGAISLLVDVGVNGSSGTPFYNAVIFPTGLEWPTVNYLTGSIETADHHIRCTYSQGFWIGNSDSFSGRSDFLTSLAQPVTILLDEGMATERRYTTSLNVGSLASMPLIPPTITSPLHNSTIGNLTTALTFQLPAGETFQGRLSHWKSTGPGSATTVDDYFFTTTPGMTSWTPPAPLSPGLLYRFELNRQYSAGDSSFSTPVDANDIPMPGWGGTTNVVSGWTESIMQFTTVPEPATLGVTGAGLAMLMVRRGSRKRQ